MNNKEIGNKTEKLCQDFVASKGWFCHILADKVNGQPFDAIALKYNKSLAFDIKHCEKDYFLTSRIEPNQRNSFKYVSTMRIKCGFALYSELKKEFYWLPYDKVRNNPDKKRFYINTLQKLEEIL